MENKSRVEEKIGGGRGSSEEVKANTRRRNKGSEKINSVIHNEFSETLAGCKSIKEASITYKKNPDDLFSVSNVESEYLHSTITEDSPIMNIEPECVQEYNKSSINAVLKGLKLKTPTGNPLPRILKPISAKEERVTFDPVYGVSEVTLEEDGVIFNIQKDVSKPRVCLVYALG